MDRHTERKHGFCLVFSLGFKLQDDPHFLDDYLEHQEIKLTTKNKAFIEKLYIGTVQKIADIDRILLQNLKNWSLDRLNKVDLAILRLAIFEMYFFDTPKKVVINEAVELAKVYSSDEAPSFINGILAGLINDEALMATEQLP